MQENKKDIKNKIINMSEPLIHYQNVEIAQQDFCVLNNVNLKLNKGDFLYIIGKVGSGKTSLLKTIYSELDIVSGEAEVLDYNLRTIKRKHIPQLRKKLGIVFQDFQLLTDRTVYDNLVFVLRATGWKNKLEINERIENVLQQVGMSDKGNKFPNELSGGEQQRIVIARAILNSPEIILADEPTGNLDVETGREIVKLLQDISKAGSSVIMTTHNIQLLREFPGIVLRCENQNIKDVTEEFYGKPIKEVEPIVPTEEIEPKVVEIETAEVVEAKVEETKEEVSEKDETSTETAQAESVSEEVTDKE